MSVPAVDPDARARLAALVTDLAVVHGRVTLSSGREADYYVDLRRATLHHEAGPLIGRLVRELTADWTYDAAGGLTLGADPVALAVMHAPGPPRGAAWPGAGRRSSRPRGPRTASPARARRRGR